MAGSIAEARDRLLDHLAQSWITHCGLRAEAARSDLDSLTSATEASMGDIWTEQARGRAKQNIAYWQEQEKLTSELLAACATGEG